MRVTHSKADLLSCEKCGYQTAYKHQLKSHQKLVHGTRTGLFVCEGCGIDCQTRYGLKQHGSEERCGVVDERVCVECRVEFRSRSKMRTHRSTVHGTGLRLSGGGGRDQGEREPPCPFHSHLILLPHRVSLCHSDFTTHVDLQP